jgi:hypothetical protein
MNNFYIYTHTKLGDTLPFYIGKGSNNRAYSKHDRSNFWKRISKNGYTVQIELTNLYEDEALQLEKEIIKMYGRRDLGTGCLVNMTNGGEGVSGRIVSDETKAKMSKAMEGRVSGNKGKTHSEETKQKISEAKLGNTAWKGKTHSDETKAKIGEAGKGKTHSDESKRKMSDAKKGKTHSDESKRKMSEARKQSEITRRENAIQGQ